VRGGIVEMLAALFIGINFICIGKTQVAFPSWLTVGPVSLCAPLDEIITIFDLCFSLGIFGPYKFIEVVYVYQTGLVSHKFWRFQPARNVF
jgi:hypothetical protein